MKFQNQLNRILATILVSFLPASDAFAAPGTSPTWTAHLFAILAGLSCLLLAGVIVYRIGRNIKHTMTRVQGSNHGLLDLAKEVIWFGLPLVLLVYLALPYWKAWV